MANVYPMLAAACRREEQGDLVGAEELFRKVLTAQATHAQAARRLGKILADAGRFAEALAVVSPAAHAHGADAALMALLGRCLFEVGQPEHATHAVEASLSIDPSSQTARVWLARCRTATHRTSEALHLLAPLLSQKPPDPDALAAAGEAHRLGGRPDEAMEQYAAALAARPTSDAHRNMAVILIDSGRPEEALPHGEKAVELNPRSASAWAMKATALQAMGDVEGARRTALAALNQGLLDATLFGIYARASQSSPGHRVEAIHRIETAITGTPPESTTRITLQVALGALKDAQGDYDGAFACFSAANERTPATFDVEAYSRAMKDVTDVFSGENLGRMPRATNTDERPIFIVGMPRSGSTLVEQILAGHPSIHPGGELLELPDLAINVPRILGLPVSSRFPFCVADLTSEQLERLAQHYLTRLGKLGGSSLRITDKMLSNVMLLGFIDRLFPRARVIHCTRHPLDTCLSCYVTPLGRACPYRTRFTHLAGAYKAYRRSADHWRSVLSIPMLEVAYEDVVADPEVHARRIIEFIGLPWDPRCTRTHENRRVANTASVDQVRRPIYTSSTQRWRRYERHLAPLAEMLKEFL